MPNAAYARLQSQCEDLVSSNRDPRFRKGWRYLLDGPPGVLLDLGCGDGAFGKPFLKLGWKVLGVDLFPSLLAQARSVGVVPVLSDAPALPFASGSIDAIFAGEIVEHQLDDLGFLGECRRVLKDRGVLLLTTPNLVSLGNRWLMLFGRVPRFAYAAFHLHVYVADDLLDKVVASGLEVAALWGSYVLVSKRYSRLLGGVGEWLGDRFPRLGEHLIVAATTTRHAS